MKCPKCGAEEQAGKYCAECGAALDANCSNCGEALAPGAGFCTACGEPVAGRASGSPGSKAPWIIAVAAVIVVLLVLFLPGDTEPVRAPAGAGGGAPGAPLSGPGAGGQPGMGGLSSDMRTNADRLFNRIMLAAEQGNQAEVAQFMPMAIQAYDMVEDLDEDGLYHLALLHLTAGDHGSARRTAQRILDSAPNHVLALAVAARAAEEAGEDIAAATLWERLVENYPAEAAKPLPEYVDNEQMLTIYRQEALEALGRDG